MTSDLYIDSNLSLQKEFSLPNKKRQVIRIKVHYKNNLESKNEKIMAKTSCFNTIFDFGVTKHCDKLYKRK